MGKPGGPQFFLERNRPLSLRLFGEGTAEPAVEVPGLGGGPN